MNRTLITFLALALVVSSAFGFTVSSQTRLAQTFSVNQQSFRVSTRVAAVDEDIAGDAEPKIAGDAEAKKNALEEKMKSWEASDEEIRAASLGGMTPGKRGTDGFDIGLYIAFPIIVATGLLFAFFPFIMDKIDVTSVGPPPIV
mmetsp:Transcript_22487/g.33321  ORF Transcript_22487/g.33321 Transcript_22487/m.33321 type:complete len:144 (+) Transcript_22487:125-556(+)